MDYILLMKVELIQVLLIMNEYWARVVPNNDGGLVFYALIVYDNETDLAHWTDLPPYHVPDPYCVRKHRFKERVKNCDDIYKPLTREEFIRAKISGVLDD